MSREDDIVPLFRQESPEPFRQGVVVSWASDGTNAIDVGGTRLINLPALNIGDFVTLLPGDVVVLAKYKQTFFVLGRVVPPGPPDVNRAVVAFDSATGTQASFAVTTSDIQRAPAVLNVPDWADEVILQAGATVQAGPATTGDFMQLQLVYGAGLVLSAGANYPVANGAYALGVVYGSRLLVAGAGTFTPGGTITVSVQVRAQNANFGTPTASTVANVDATAIFRRTA